jgi:hypothetical protein
MLNHPGGAVEGLFTWPDRIYLSFERDTHGAPWVIVHVRDVQRGIRLSGAGIGRSAAEENARQKYIAALFEANR